MTPSGADLLVSPAWLLWRMLSLVLRVLSFQGRNAVVGTAASEMKAVDRSPK